MQVLILGATGGTGRELVKQALGHGHSVRVMARNPDRVKSVHPRLEVVKGDIADTTALTAAAKGQEAVLSALGVNDRKPNTILSEGVRNLVRAMKRQKLKRLIFVSSLGVGDSKGQLGPLYNRVLLPTLLKNIFADKERAEEAIRESGLEWTIVRPGALSNKLLTNRYRVGADAADKRWFPRVGRADVADFMLDALEHHRFVREAPGICY
ncbi:MAG TPA: SDR family oxidoreductase [Longimicrobium sp.]|nr:SDR family oxidoreductase [Longimicrobium sp.]